MKAFRILLHALRQVFGNSRQVLAISVPPLAIQAILLGIVVSWLAGLDGNQPSGGWFLTVLALGLVYLLSLVWLAVRWHRFVLLNEQENLLSPPPRAAMMRYVGVCLLIALAMFAAALLIGLVVTAVAAGGGGLLAVLAAVAMAILAHGLALILGTALPGTAIGARQPVRAAWESMKPAGGTVLLLAIIALAVNALAEAASMAVEASDLPDALIFGFILVFYWLASLVTLSVLTTLWGHYVEGRPLR